MPWASPPAHRSPGACWAPGIGFDDLDYTFDIGYDAEPLLIICDVVSSTIRRDGEGSEETFGPGDQFLICQSDLPYAGVAHATRYCSTTVRCRGRRRCACNAASPTCATT